LDNLKSSEFKRINGEAKQLIKDLKYSEAVTKLQEAFKWAADSTQLQKQIDSLMEIGKEEIQFNLLMQEAENLEKTESSWQKAIGNYQKAMDLQYNKNLASQKKSSLQARYNEKLAGYKSSAKKYIEQGEAFKKHALEKFIKPGLLLSPNDAELLRLKKIAKQK